MRIALRNIKGDGAGLAPMEPGHYMSVITAADPPMHRPLAMLHVLVQPT